MVSALSGTQPCGAMHGVVVSTLINNNNRTERRNLRFLRSPHCAANHLQHVRLSGPGAIICKSCATHRALIMCNMSCCVPHGKKGQLIY